MAQYKGILQGQGKPTQKFGTKNSGIYAEVNGWDIGGLVRIKHDAELKRDEVLFEITGGSGSSPFAGQFVARFRLDKDGKPERVE